MADNDADTKPLVIRKDKVNYLTVLQDGKVGIGKAEPKASLDVNGDIRANFFRAGEGHSRRLPVGKRPVGAGPDLSAIVRDEDIKWYRIAKVASPEFALAGATFSVRASIAGKTSHVLVCQLISSTRRPSQEGPVRALHGPEQHGFPGLQKGANCHRRAGCHRAGSIHALEFRRRNRRQLFNLRQSRFPALAAGDVGRTAC